MTDGADGLFCVLHFTQKDLYLGHHAQSVGVYSTAWEMNCVELIGGNVPDCAIDLDPDRLIEVVTDRLDMALRERNNGHLGTRIPECLYGLGQLRFLDAVGGNNCHTKAS